MLGTLFFKLNHVFGKLEEKKCCVVGESGGMPINRDGRGLNDAVISVV